MDTSEFIRMLAADKRRLATPLSAMWWAALGLAIAIAAVVFFTVLGLRPDIATAVESYRFLFKFLVTVTLAVSAFFCARALSRPDGSWRKAFLCLAAAPALIAMAVVAELLTLPPDAWSATLIGTNSIACLTYIPLVGIGPLAIFLWILHYGAPTRPALAGAVAGLLAGAIAATFYAAHCIDDSALFVATWYTIAVAGLALAGAAGAYRIARW